MARGLFLTFEGCDGCGKTTVLNRVSVLLREKGIPFLLTREPGGSKIAEEIRNVILDKKNTEMDPRCEALLYAASRRQHLVEIVLPALEKGIHVLSDRYLDSSLAYQGYARGIGMEEVYSINLFAIDGMLPDLTFFLDLPPEEGLARIRKNETREVNRLDLEKENFHKKVYEGYKILLENYPERIVRIDAKKTVEEESQEIFDILAKRIMR
ncbi:MAG TPA: dTMP kinase [Candidatus Enterosoma merdigallinarum]|nr:dTMP kinase [Candidatus Enterosoma merdigallinarum]